MEEDDQPTYLVINKASKQTQTSYPQNQLDKNMATQTAQDITAPTSTTWNPLYDQTTLDMDDHLLLYIMD